MKEKTCNKCGKKVNSYTYGFYCSSCADDVWDAGFESTTQHAEEIYEAEIKDREEINEMLNKKDIDFEAIEELMIYNTGRLRCAKCNYVRINTKYLDTIKEKGKFIENLKKRCSKCGLEGFYIYENR